VKTTSLGRLAARVAMIYRERERVRKRERERERERERGPSWQER